MTTRRALELAVKWIYSNDCDLAIPYQDNLGALIHNYTFKSIIDKDLFPKLSNIQKLGNKAVHTSKAIRREEIVHALNNLFEFILWIDYSYSQEYEENLQFDESILGGSTGETKTRKEIKDLYEKLGANDRKLEEVIKENEELRKSNTQRRKQNKQERTFNVDTISEYKTRKMYIDLELELKGWTIGDDCLEEVEVLGIR